jgi:hypothetical protein
MVTDCSFVGMPALQDPFGLPAFHGGAPPLPPEPEPPLPVEPPVPLAPAAPLPALPPAEPPPVPRVPPLPPLEPPLPAPKGMLPLQLAPAIASHEMNVNESG